MNITYRQLKAFVALADTQSYTLAAEKVHVTQSALSQMVRKLSTQVSCELVEQRNRQVVLTEAGASFYLEASMIVNRLDKWEQDNKARMQGKHETLVISSLYSMCASLVPQTIHSLKEQNPLFSFRLIEERVDDINSSVLDGRADIGLGTPPNNPQLNFEPLFRDHLCFACKAGHPLTKLKEVSWQQAHMYASIGISPGNSLRMLADQAFMNAGLAYDPEVCVSHTSTLLGMIESGLGSSILSSTIAQLHANEQLKFIPIVRPVQYRSIGIITKKETHRQITDEFISGLKKKVVSLAN
ncbi:LysR family transcriptional regulator [Vibrio sp. SCSIO 43135]|uniref:LysR family transcriptional regulator n=1 Tax=Vibrio paucivorans TaxID=2829489 RepID=A0A9X3CBG4_9VIBR|nr:MULTISPECIES: LysR family transcriptional regulator [Vibrio]MCW8332596.1 LysR family transcriptional regulator [Vibrio paucivorans]USD42711.1 LysR family transcriptional regulator [Vibrio sp. SCSIO 43135]